MPLLASAAAALSINTTTATPSTNTTATSSTNSSTTGISEGTDTNKTKSVRLQLNHNTTKCLSAIMDSDGYAQPELTFVQNCTYSTVWVVPFDFDQQPGEVVCGECNELPILDGGKYGNQTNQTVLAMPDEQRMGQKWMIDSDQRISLRPPTDPTKATFCLGETIDDKGGSYVRTEYCGDGPDSGGSKINQIWNLIDVEKDT
ncbi:hypothetical protein L486_02434 [Kwoniella mangroviensis CBS 10435]|uniref:Ricin B lectin domain-containing protein n=2 Tax=Kwoniella mangrovensis TaxID=463800 RepID=A0A1B9IW61_9TREE|nr:hypothetical protein L486_02434 [Kwoniella mangroviensis CBS 10435]